MKRSFEKCLIEQCAPALAGIKVGNLFFYKSDKEESVGEVISYWNHRLAGKGLRICLIKESACGGLLYVFRPYMLEALLADDEVIGFLNSRDYPICFDVDVHIKKLQYKFKHEETFPHEIGIFLGYPISDVRGFIENGGKKFLATGAWKVYGNPKLAEQKFKRYKKCRKIYSSMFERGYGINTLAVSI